MSISIITIQDKKSIEKGLAKNLVKSLTRFNHELTVIDTFDHELGLLSKIYKVRDYLSQNHASFRDSDVVVFVDAHDVIFPPHIDARKNHLPNLRRAFLNTELDYVVAAETRYAHQLPELKDFFDRHSNEKSRYINTGFQIGYYSSFIDIYSYIIENIEKYRFNNFNDQGAISQFYIEQTADNVLPGVKIGMDHKREFISTLNSRTEFNPADIDSYFIHVTWLENTEQLQKFNEVLKYYGI